MQHRSKGKNQNDSHPQTDLALRFTSLRVDHRNFTMLIMENAQVEHTKTNNMHTMYIKKQIISDIRYIYKIISMLAFSKLTEIKRAIN